MASTWTMLGLVAAVWLVSQSALMVVQAWENRRFVLGRLAKPLPSVAPPRTLLVAPCKGHELGLEENLSRLLTQDHGNFAVRFVVESQDDPAADVIRQLMARVPQVPLELIVAGRATDGGQKVHNLRAATWQIPEEVEVLAFVDSDARPRSDWLRALSVRAAQADVGAVTGYRWFVPQCDTWPNRLLYSVNSGLAGLLGPGGHYLVWGGSWAITRQEFMRLGMRDAWHGTLSDDLVASRVLRAAGQRVEFEPRAMVASPIDVTAAQAWEFLVRQLRIARLYLPRWWAWLAVAQGAQAAAMGLLLVAWVARGATADRWWLGLSAGIALHLGLNMWRGWLRQQLPWAYGLAGQELPGEEGIPVPVTTGQASSGIRAREVSALAEPVPHSEKHNALAAGRRWDIWLAPWSSWLLFPAVAASALGRQLTWRGIRYRLRPGGQVTEVERLDEPHQQASRPVSLELPMTRDRSSHATPPGHARRW